MKTIRYGIIGLGHIARKFADAINRVEEGVELAAVASRDQARSDRFKEEFGAAKAYGNYNDLIADPDVDAVYIALTHNFHFECAKKSLEGGKAVHCEKPFFTNRKEADELVALAKQKNLLIMEGMWSRVLPTTIRAKEWAQGGRIGEIKLVQASFAFNATKLGPTHRLFDPAVAGGALWDAGVYPIEFATGILGENPTVVKGVAQFGETGVDTYVAMSLGFDSGAVAALSCGLTARSNQDGKIFGTDGHIVVHGFLAPEKVELFDLTGEVVETFGLEFENGFQYQIAHFAELYRSGKKESDIIPLADTVACAGIFDELFAQFKGARE